MAKYRCLLYGNKLLFSLSLSVSLSLFLSASLCPFVSMSRLQFLCSSFPNVHYRLLSNIPKIPCLPVHFRPTNGDSAVRHCSVALLSVSEKSLDMKVWVDTKVVFIVWRNGRRCWVSQRVHTSSTVTSDGYLAAISDSWWPQLGASYSRWDGLAARLVLDCPPLSLFLVSLYRASDQTTNRNVVKNYRLCMHKYRTKL